MRRVGGIGLFVLGLALILYGVLSSGHRQRDVTVEIPAGDSQFVYTAPGVLALGASSVDVTLSAPDQTINWGIAPYSEVQAFVGDSSATEVTGLESWSAAAVQAHEGTQDAITQLKEAAEAGNFSMDGADIMDETGVIEGTDTLHLEVDSSYQQSLLVTTTAATAPAVTLHWVHTIPGRTPMPFILIGVLSMLIAALLFLGHRQGGLLERRQQQRIARQALETEVIPRVQIDKEEDAAEADRSTHEAGAAKEPAVEEQPDAAEEPAADEEENNA